MQPTFERTWFNKCNQLEGKSAEQYITTLYQFAERYEYGDIKLEMILDILVVSFRDTALSEKLQMDPGLTLERTLRLIRQREVVHEQQDTLKDPKKDRSLTSEYILDYVKNSVKARGSHKGKG